MSRADSPQSPTRHSTRGAAKSNSKKQSAARHDDAGLIFPWLPDALNMVNAWRLAIRRKQARAGPEQPKKHETVLKHDGTPEGLRKALRKADRLAPDLTGRHIFKLVPPRLLPEPGVTTRSIPIHKAGSTPGTVIELLPGWRVEWSPGRRVFSFGSQKEISIDRHAGRPGKDELAEAAYLMHMKIMAANPGEREPWQRVVETLDEQLPDDMIAEAAERLRCLVNGWLARRKKARTTPPTPK